MKHTFWVIGSLLLSASAFAQEDVEAAAAQEDAAEEGVAIAVAANSDRVTQAVDQELKILQRLTDLSDEAIEGLKLGLKPFLAEEKKRLGSKGSFFGGVEMLSSKTLNAIADATDAIVTDKKKAEAYRSDSKTRYDFQMTAAITSLVVTIDSWVGLTEDQLGPIRTEVAKLFDEGKISFEPIIDFETLGGPEALKSIEPLLTQQQLGFYKKFGKERASGFVGPEEEQPEDARAKLLSKLRDVASMRIARLKAELGLDAKQLRRLELVGKRVVSEALERRLEAEKKYGQYQLDAQAGAPARFDEDMMSVVMAHPVHLFDSQDSWSKYVRGILSDEKKATLAKLNTVRGKRNADMLGYMLVVSLGREIKMSGKQQLATHKLFSDAFGPIKTPSITGIGLGDTYAKILTITEDEYTVAMGEQNWAQFKPLLEQVRQQLEDRKRRKANEEK